MTLLLSIFFRYNDFLLGCDLVTWFSCNARSNSSFDDLLRFTNTNDVHMCCIVFLQILSTWLKRGSVAYYLRITQQATCGWLGMAWSWPLNVVSQWEQQCCQSVIIFVSSLKPLIASVPFGHPLFSFSVFFNMKELDDYSLKGNAAIALLAYKVNRDIALLCYLLLCCFCAHPCHSEYAMPLKGWKRSERCSIPYSVLTLILCRKNYEKTIFKNSQKRYGRKRYPLYRNGARLIRNFRDRFHP